MNELGWCLVFSESQTGTIRQVARVRKEPGGGFEEMSFLDICEKCWVGFVFPKLISPALFSYSDFCSGALHAPKPIPVTLSHSTQPPGPQAPHLTKTVLLGFSSPQGLKYQFSGMFMWEAVYGQFLWGSREYLLFCFNSLLALVMERYLRERLDFQHPSLGWPCTRTKLLIWTHGQVNGWHDSDAIS